MKIVVDNPSCKVIVNESSVVKINTNTEPIKINVTGGRGRDGEGKSYISTSAYNFTPAIGYLELFINETEMPYTIGQRIRVVADNDPFNYFEGIIDTYPGEFIIYMNVDIISEGTGRHNSWVINITGEPGSSDGIIPGLPDAPYDVNYIFNETPTGVMDAVNTVFTTNNDFISTKTRLYLNGIRLKLDEDYTESGSSEITFTEAPHSGDNIIIDYLIIT
jgi:hypothetical protein